MTAPSAAPSAPRVPSPVLPRALPILAGGFLGLAALGLGLFLGGSFSGDGDPARAWSLATRFTARVSAWIFLVVFLIGPLAARWPRPWLIALRQRRRQIGLGFALAHTIHLGALTMRAAVTGDMPSGVTLAAGGLAYLFIAAMAATSNDAALRRLGGWWHRLHRTGLYYIWANFTLTYAGHLAAPETWAVGAYGTSLFLAALALRLGLRWLPARKPA